MSRLLVLGNAGLDLSLPIPRLPHAGETLVGGPRSVAPGGKGLNQAVVAARTGLVPVLFCAPLGDDLDAGRVETLLRQEAFATLDLPRRPGPSDLSILLVSSDGENCIVTSGECAARLPLEDAARFAGAAQPGDWVLLQGNLTASASMAALCAAEAAGGRTMLNTAPLSWDAGPMLPHCSVVIANAVEAKQLTGLDGSAAAAALHAAGAALAIVTLGAAGCVAAGPSGVQRHPALPVLAVDSTGAGDTFCGVLAAMLAGKRIVAQAVTVAQRAAALTVGRRGAFAALPSAAELRAILGSQPAT